MCGCGVPHLTQLYTQYQTVLAYTAALEVEEAQVEIFPSTPLDKSGFWDTLKALYGLLRIFLIGNALEVVTLSK